jgi:UDP-N-acetylglucosamine pyrophosphorylase
MTFKQAQTMKFAPLKQVQTMKFAQPDTCLEDYEKRRGAFLKDLIASTPNVSLRAKEFRRWIEKNSPYSDADAE